MSLPSGSFRLSPDDATLTVRTGVAGAMAKAGHRLELRVSAWSAQLELGEDPTDGSLSLQVDSSSFQVIDGQGGPKAMTDDDRSKVLANIDTKVLKGQEITFTSTALTPAGESALEVEGQLTLLGTTGPARFTLQFGDQAEFSARTEIVQSAFGMEPYSAMMGALKVADEVGIEIAGHLPGSAAA